MFYDEGSWVETRNEIHARDGFSPNQTFYLCEKDRASGDVGYIDFFEIWIWYDENQCPNPPEERVDSSIC